MLGFVSASRRREFETLIAPCLDGMFSAALRLTKHQGNAEDLVQDTVVRAWKFFDKFERGTNFKAWIFRILTNTFINTYRRSNRERSLNDEGERQSVEATFYSPDAIADSLNPEEAMLAHVMSDEVLQAVDALPVDFRMVVVLADLQDFAYNEIATILNIPVGTVMSRLFRARRQLQKSLSAAAQNEKNSNTVDINVFRERHRLASDQ